MASLYVGNLHPECTEALLYQKFSPLGNLLNIRLCKDSKTGRCTGYGFINYASKTDAQVAIISLNYTLLKGRHIRLMWSEKNIKNLSPEANIFIKNLSANIDERSLHDIFANYGNILSLQLARNEDGSSKGYAFIQFGDKNCAEEAIKEVNGKIICGKVVQLTRFIPQDKRLSKLSQFLNVYIKNFDMDITDKDLYDMCKQYGEINSAKVMMDDEGNSKCFGFVSFRNQDSAKEAVEGVHGKMLNGRRLFADRAKKKAERQKEVIEKFKHSLQSVESNCI